ncbi:MULTISPECIES: flagellar hook-basal body complex protein FliE [unclassified Pseudomonas]|uniref:flagellar hook-basal body complex protein FliE n=1 Tax=unclassified Pseudomonas TaxID=196821 RepID=UPI00026FEEB0|nr:MULTISPECIES: flagellar hook-basal body complex protein FliE [unclassified Pseudomonas]EJM54438.1 flagellar hook-basal body complex protein FliE [Pseudomonas sp. GM48]PMZ73755.1 flagellar hook-basal body complex protein FliE [Pseudomonas sp. FW305-70]
MTAAIAPIALTTDLSPASALADGPMGPQGTDFVGLLKSGATQLSAQTGQASELLSAYALGENIAPHDLVMAMEQAKLSLQLAVEVRNRLVDAYQELTRLQI